MKKTLKTILIIFLAILILSAFFNSDSSDDVSIEDAETTESVAESTLPTEVVLPTDTAAPTSTPTPTHTALPQNSTFEIYYLDVGQGDAAVVLCDGKAMLIDGGDNKQSSLIYSFLKSHKISHLDYIIATHPDADHIGGLSGALNYATVDKAFCTVTSHDTKTFGSFVKYLNAQNVSITVPSAGDKFSLGSATFTIIGPPHGNDYGSNTSIVLRIEYGDTSFLFTGDCETDEEKGIMNAGYDVKSTVLKVGHHGSRSSTSYQFLYYVEPEYAVISVGGKNSYGHPTDEVLSRLHDADVKTFRTDMQGDVHCVSDGKSVTFDVKKNSNFDPYAVVGGYASYVAAQTKATPTPTPVDTTRSITDSNGTTYILNTNTHKFHYPGCSSVNQMSEGNKQSYTGSRDEVIAMGYSPCGRCHP